MLSIVLVNNSFANVKDETCLECHDDAVSTMMMSPTMKVSCEACHGNADQHIDDPSPENIITLLDPTLEQVKTACFKCHSDKHALKSSHIDQEASCLGCHKIMVKKNKNGIDKPNHALLKDESYKLCLTCHTEKMAAINLPFTHRADEYDNVCLNCHNAHESKVEIKSKELEAKCKSCHPEAGGPFMYVHMGAENEGCVECHSPHGSTNSNMLNRHDVKFLCLSCHTDTPAFHNISNSKYQQCTSCHSAIHGSNVNNKFFE